LAHHDDVDRVDHFGRDLYVVLDRAKSPSLRVQLEEQLREGVRSGRLHAGTALPSTRALASELGVARGVVVAAYSQLVAEGFLVARRGAATQVARVAPAEPVVSAPTARMPPARFDFRAEAADRSAFPRRAWMAAARRATAGAHDSDLGYGTWAGAPALRAALASYLGRARGVVAQPDRIVVTAGITQAIALLAAALRRRGARSVLVEAPGFGQHRTLLERAGLEPIPVDVDDGGLRTDALPRAAAALVTPAHQMPTGAVLRPERRAALLDWAAANDALVLEDDYDGEYRYDREPLGALQGLGPGRVVYMGSTSKTLAPALRLGWMVVPGDFAGELADDRGWADGGSPVLDQLTLATFIERGELDRHLRRMRLRYRRRRDALIAALARHLPEAEIGGVAAGLHVAVGLPPGTDVDAISARAAKRGVGVLKAPHADRPLLLVGYANIADAAIEPGVRELAAAVRD
jgi:GntR family transcriptional regulator / MocR family aminotransferase